MADWNQPEERQLIDERKSRNSEYHSLKNGQPKHAFWNNIAQNINNRHNTTYTGINVTISFSTLHELMV